MSDLYTDEQTFYILQQIGVQVVTDTPTHWQVLCPFHGNVNTPAMTVDKELGLFHCFNGGCEVSGSLRYLIKALTKKTEFQIEVLIHKAKQGVDVDIQKVIEKSLSHDEIKPYPAERIDALENYMWKYGAGRDYLHGRGFTDETIKQFRVGYNPKRKLVTVPMFTHDGTPIGFIGRSIFDKRFKNSPDLPKRLSLFNINNAKKSPTVAVTEASFDAMRFTQATGIPAVATLGSSLSANHAEQLNKYFTRILIATDDDPTPIVREGRCRKCMKDRGSDVCQGHYAGNELGLSIAEQVKGVKIEWLHMDDHQRYGGAKDVSDLTDEQIKEALTHSKSHFEMVMRLAQVA